MQQNLATTSQPRMRSGASSTTLLAALPDSTSHIHDADTTLSGSDALLLALDRLVCTIAGLPDHELIGNDTDCRALSNFSNFPRALAERRVRQEPVFQAALPGLASACCRLIVCINGDTFAGAWPSDQSLVNLVS
jgi:hypothetical protein